MAEHISTELEYTFLAREIPAEISGVTPLALEDVYFPENPSVHAQLRARKKNDSYEITKKIPVTEGDASAQIETTIPLNVDEYTSLTASSTRRVRKDRYNTLIAGYPAEVDIFKGRLAGLVLIDFEFETDEQKLAFRKPECCLADVTQEEYLAGGVLSALSYGDIARDLGRLGYTGLTLDAD